jgi:DnaJ homolog subfamily A member 2
MSEGPGNLYDVLGVEQGADTNEIKKAYKNLSRIHHPDKGGDPEMFKKIQHAHEVLTDDRRRQVYDMTGSEDGQQGMNMNMGGGMPFDIGSMFANMGGLGGMFGMGGMPGMGGRQQVRRMPKAPPKIHELPLRLHDYYHGRVFQVKFDRQKFCETCKGEGATSFQSCSPCQGRGVQRQVIMMGPMQMINEGPCNQCNGQGKVPSGACYVCSGKKTRNQEKTLDVKIEPGMKPSETLIFENECSDDPRFDQPGDVHFVLTEAEGDDGWSRKGDDLETDIHIVLSESLLGCKKQLKGHPGYPDGLDINIPCGTVNNEVIRVADKGMTKRHGGYGNLLFRVHVTVTDRDRELLHRNELAIAGMFA